MSTHHHSRLATGVLAALALLSAACNDPTSSHRASRISSPPLFSRSSDHDRSSGGAGFSVLAHAAVSCTGGSITGDVGTFQTAPPGAITLTGGCLIPGAQDIGGAAAVAAYQAFLAQYGALAPKSGDVCPVITGTLAGQTLTPGVYCVSSEAKTGVFTLQGGSNATWLIKVPSGALTGTNFSVVLAGGAQACNVTWWVDAASTMTTSAFQGNILAGAAITFTGGTLNGNAYAGAAGVGDVTFTGTAVVGCGSRRGHGRDNDNDHDKCNQGVGNGSEGCDPGNSNHRHGSNDEDGGKPGDPGRRGDH
jgi:ice-binding like protein